MILTVTEQAVWAWAMEAARTMGGAATLAGILVLGMVWAIARMREGSRF